MLEESFWWCKSRAAAAAAGQQVHAIPTRRHRPARLAPGHTGPYLQMGADRRQWNQSLFWLHFDGGGNPDKWLEMVYRN